MSTVIVSDTTSLIVLEKLQSLHCYATYLLRWLSLTCDAAITMLNESMKQGMRLSSSLHTQIVERLNITSDT